MNTTELPSLVQRVALAVESGNADLLSRLLNPRPAPCTPPGATGLGRGPDCPAGVGEGTLIGSYVDYGQCEGWPVTPEGAVRNLLDLAQQHPALRYVVVASKPVDTNLPATYFLVFEPRNVNTGWFVSLSTSGIVGINRACGSATADQLVPYLLQTRVKGVPASVYSVKPDVAPTATG